MILKTIFSLLAALSFLFFFWRKLREDYTQNQVFNVGFYSLLGIFVFSIFSNYYFPVYMFWLSFLGAIVGLVVGINRFHFRLFESLEAWISGNISVLFFFYIYESVIKFDLFNAYAALFSAFLIFLFLFLDKHYKKFNWYKSGRVGFSGLIIMGIFFLTRSLIAIVIPNMLFFVGKIDAIISGVLAFISFLTLFNLAKREVK